MIFPVDIPNELISNLSDLGMFVFLMNKFGKNDRFTIKAVCLETGLNKRTVSKSLERLYEIGLLIKGERYEGYRIPVSDSEVHNLTLEVQKVPHEVQNMHHEVQKVPLEVQKVHQQPPRETEEERTKEEDKENYKQESIYNNNSIRVKENEKEREIKEREKDPQEVDETSVPEKSERFAEQYREIIAYLNEKTGKHYSWRSRANQEHMSARLREGRTVEDFKRVIDIKCFQWLDDPKMSQYLRPETLFSGKFDRYLNEDFKVIRKGLNGVEYVVTDEPSELDAIF